MLAGRNFFCNTMTASLLVEQRKRWWVYDGIRCRFNNCLLYIEMRPEICHMFEISYKNALLWRNKKWKVQARRRMPSWHLHDRHWRLVFTQVVNHYILSCQVLYKFTLHDQRWWVDDSTSNVAQTVSVRRCSGDQFVTVYSRRGTQRSPPQRHASSPAVSGLSNYSIISISVTAGIVNCTVYSYGVCETVWYHYFCCFFFSSLSLSG